MRPTRHGSPGSRPSLFSMPNCLSSTRTIICGSVRTIGICSTSFSPTSRQANISWPPCSWNVMRCTGPTARPICRPVGQTEFVAGVAAMSESGLYGRTRVAAGIVGFADLTLGAESSLCWKRASEPGVGASGACDTRRREPDASSMIGNSRTAHRPHLMRARGLPRRPGGLTALGLSLDAWAFHPQLADITDLARDLPQANIIVNHVGGPLGYGPYTGKRREVFAVWKAGVAELAKCPNVVMKLGGMMMRLAAYDYQENEGHSAIVGRPRYALATLHRAVHGAYRGGSLHVREQFPGGEDGHRMGRPVERVRAQLAARRHVGGREAGALQRDGTAGVPAKLRGGDSMQFGLYSSIANPPRRERSGPRDRRGHRRGSAGRGQWLHSCFFGERRQDADGFLPSPLIVATAVAAHTRR